MAEPIAALRVCSETVLVEGIELGELPPMAVAQDLGRYGVEEVRTAARNVERTVQEKLQALGGAGTVVPLRIARTLWDAQWQAHAAVFAVTGSRKNAKLLQREAAGSNAPLTVCVGKRFRRFDEATMRFNAPDMFDEENFPGRVPFVPLGYGDGCGLIIEDGGMGKPAPPKRYCVRCRARAGRTLNAGLVKNALARLRAGRKSAAI